MAAAAKEPPSPPRPCGDDQQQEEEVLFLLPPNTYALMVHKLYADRVQDYLYPSTRSSSLMLFDNEPDNNNNSKSSSPWYQNNNNNNKDRHCYEILDSQNIQGRRGNLQGYVVLLVKGVGATAAAATAATDPTTSTAASSSRPSSSSSSRRPRRLLKDLSPMARQNISWVFPISHGIRVSSSCDGAAIDGNKKQEEHRLGWHLYRALQAAGFDFTNTAQEHHHRLRVDVYPRDKIEDVCRQLQQEACCHNATTTTTTTTTGGQCSSMIQQQSTKDDDDHDDHDDDAFAGPIELVLAKSKCTHRLMVVIQSNNNGDDDCCYYYWGIAVTENNDGTVDNDNEVLHLKLNHDAADEIVVQPCNNQTGADDDSCCSLMGGATDHNTNNSINKNNIPPTVPLSRAYYKLDQVWHDYLKHEKERLQLDQGAALDLGACPGGWTQVLLSIMGMRQVVAVDRGQLAARLTQLPTVTFLQSSIQEAQLAPHGPYSITVCDASIVWSEMLDVLLNMTTVQKAKWLLPSVFVVTLKLPFKRLVSIERNLEEIHERLPRQLDDMAERLYPGQRIKSTYRVVHLMANSISERTLIAVFEEQNAYDKSRTIRR